MAIKIVLGIVAYLLCGTITLAVMKWHDRKCESYFDKWLMDIESEDSIIVMIWPTLATMGLLHVVLYLPGLFAKGIMIATTAAVYTIKAIVKGTEDGDNKAGDGKSENNR